MIGAPPKHGLTHTPEYEAWAAMHARCGNPRCKSYKDYGGRGIRVCERWKSFEAFIADMGRRPDGCSLDRFPDNNGNYEPGNCRWATSRQQGNNKRNNVWLTLNGQTKTFMEWAREYGIPRGKLRKRLKAGWPLQEALTRPSSQGQRIGKRKNEALSGRQPMAAGLSQPSASHP